MTTNMVYIHSMNKYISMDEFRQHTYKEGCAYKINDGYFHKCVGVTPEGTPIVETLSILNRVNGGNTQIIIDKPDIYSTIPSLDFVNGIMSGKYKEIPVEEYDGLVGEVDEFAKNLELKTKNI